MTFLLGKWLQAMKRKVAVGARTRPNRIVPQLEALEDRTVPSTLTVTSPADSGSGSLRAEITAANSGDTINFAPSLAGQTITLTNGELPIAKSLDIEGLGANQLTISAVGFSRVFDITAGDASVTLAGLTISGGLDYYGGGISNVGTLTVNDCALTGNSAYLQGGAIDNGGVLTVNNSTLSGNVANGSFGGDGKGGAIYMGGGKLSLNSSSVSNNSAQGGFGTTGYSTGPSGPTAGFPAGNGLGGGLYVAAFRTAYERGDGWRR